jgi:O-antigen ligase
MINTILNKENLPVSIIYLLIIILPITLVSGPFLSDLSISIITILFIYISFKNKLYFYYKNIYSKIFVIFFIILLITSIFSIDPFISLKKTIFFFRFWIFTLAVWFIFNLKKEKLLNFLIVTFTFVFIILIIDGYIQFFFKENIFGWAMQGSRVSSLFKDELILGSYLSRLLPIYFALLVFTKFDKKKYKYLIFFTIFVGIETLTFLSGERVAFFFINASSIMLILTMKDYKIFRIFSIITSIILIFFLINLYPKSTDRIINKTINQLGFEKKIENNNKLSDVSKTNNNKLSDVAITKQKKYIFSLEHQNHYLSSLRMFKDNIITGIGPRMFRYMCPLEKYNIWEGCSTHPHNTYIQLLTETGIIGFSFGAIIFLIIFISIIKHFIYKLFKNKFIFNDFQLCLLSAFMISIWPLVPTGGFFNNWLNIIYFFPIGLYLNTIEFKNK